ncbi:MAG TPA: sulfate adenylyltransferase subunit CysN [Burkholderiales bacterium]|nr:sulfate adenylyltransferase subunit CysN [Burkholderiales bacterium]
MSAIEKIAFPDIELSRFITAGSVDDGKSTLIGRLLYDSKSIFEDQLTAIEKTTRRKGLEGVDLSLLTDGLQAEREQGITIDVAYRYFATPNRKFIIADTPGHEQYTRNMVTGASTANLAVVLIDARKGVLTQSRRHAYIASLVGIPHLVVAVNKMDLVGYSQDVFNVIKQDFSAFADRLNIHDIHYIPISALHGDMVVERGDNLQWYEGKPMLELLETVEIASDINIQDFRFPVQWVCRPADPAYQDFRGYMGRIESGEIRVGDKITVLPSGLTSAVKEIATLSAKHELGFAPQSVTLQIEDHIDISRGDMLVKSDNLPQTTREFGAMLCWLSEQPLDVHRKYFVKHTTKTVKGLVSQLDYRVDVNTLERVGGITELRMNEIGCVRLKVQQPLMWDAYDRNRATGSFILIDEATQNTVAAGMIIESL